MTGTYSGGMTATMAPAEDKPGYMLLGAVAEGPDSNWFFKLTGPEATVKAHVTVILRKLGVRSRTQAVIEARSLALPTT